MIFGSWELPESELLEAAQRLERARSIKADKILDINAPEQTGEIAGSDGYPYLVSLSECECADFHRRGFPCKHMMRLALELGIAFDVPQFDPYAAAEYNVEDEIQRLMERWKAGQLTLDALSKCTLALRSSASKSKRRPGRPKKK